MGLPSGGLPLRSQLVHRPYEWVFPLGFSLAARAAARWGSLNGFTTTAVPSTAIFSSIICSMAATIWKPLIRGL